MNIDIPKFITVEMYEIKRLCCQGDYITNNPPYQSTISPSEKRLSDAQI